MGLFSNMKRMLSIRLNKVVKAGTTSIEVLEYEITESKERIDKLGDKISSLRADRKVALSDKEALELKNQSLKDVLDTAVQEDDAELGNEALTLIEKNDAKIEVYSSNIQYYDNVISKLEEQYESLKAKYEEKAIAFEKLQMQAKFADNMKSINEEIKKNYSSDDFDFSGIEAIEKEIKKSVHFETDRNGRLSEQGSVEARLQKATSANKFEEYKRKLAEEQGE